MHKAESIMVCSRIDPTVKILRNLLRDTLYLPDFVMFMNLISKVNTNILDFTKYLQFYNCLFNHYVISTLNNLTILSLIITKS